MSDAHAPAPSPDGAAPPPSKIKQMLPVVLALVAGLGAGGGTGKFVVGPALASGIAPSGKGVGHAKSSDEGGDEAAADDDEGASDEEGDAEGEHASGKEGESEGATKAVHTLDNIVLNPAESGGGRFLLLSITFQSPDASVVEAMKARDAELRDVVLVTLGAKTVEQLADMRTREVIKTDLIAATRKLLKKKKAKLHIFFPQFVIQ